MIRQSETTNDNTIETSVRPTPESLGRGEQSDDFWNGSPLFVQPILLDHSIWRLRFCLYFYVVKKATVSVAKEINQNLVSNTME